MKSLGIAGLALAMAANIGHHPTLKAAFFHRVLPGLGATAAEALRCTCSSMFMSTRASADRR